MNGRGRNDISQQPTQTFGSLAEASAPVLSGHDEQGGAALCFTLSVLGHHADLTSVVLPHSGDLHVVHHAIVRHLKACALLGCTYNNTL